MLFRIGLLVAIGMGSLSAITEEKKLAYGSSIMEATYRQSEINQTRWASVKMVIITEKGGKKERNFDFYKQDTPSVKQSLIRFFKPNSIKKTSLLSETNRKKNQKKQWIYFPFQRQVRLLSSNERHQSFLGSDFSNADMGGRSLDDDKHRLIKTTDSAYVIESIPVDEEDLYAKLIHYVDKKKKVFTQVEFYNQEGLFYKELINTQFEEEKGEFVPKRSVMTNQLRGSKTSLEMESVKLGVKFSNTHFNLKQLGK